MWHGEQSPCPTNTYMKNIIFITTDEQHKQSISHFGATTHETKSIDYLAEHGTVYDNAYSVSPVCLPSRCSWMTGMEPHKSGSISNVFGASLSLQYPNLFTELKKNGYRTSLHGKCHFIPVPYPATRADMTLEYEHFITYYKTLGMDHLDLQDDKNNSLWYYDDYSKQLEKKDKLTAYRDQAHMTPSNQGVFPFPWEAEEHPDAWVGQKTLERIQSADTTTPDFIWCSFSGPHYPVDTPQEYIDRVDMAKDQGRIFSPDEWDDRTKYHSNGYWGPGTTEGSGNAPDDAQKNYSEAYWTKWRQSYFGNVVLIDDYIGKILAAAQEKWGDDFVVVFTSDHGEMMGNHSLWGKNGSLYEDVLRVPLIVFEPGQKATTRNEIVSSLDVFPTIMRYAGIEPHALCDGLPLEEQVARGGRDSIISECEDRIAYIKDGYKLEWNFYDKKDILYKEFYDLNKDPHEFQNLYGNAEYKEIIDEFEKYLEKREREEKLLSTLFYHKKGLPYYLNYGEGAGLLNK